MSEPALEKSNLRQRSKSGAVPNPKHRPLSDLPSDRERAVARKVLELQGEDADLVILILREWIGNQRRRLSASDKRWLSGPRLKEVVRQERRIARVEGWVKQWEKIGGGLAGRNGK